jgi:hypothetical protein
MKMCSQAMIVIMHDALKHKGILTTRLTANQHKDTLTMKPLHQSLIGLRNEVLGMNDENVDVLQDIMDANAQEDHEPRNQQLEEVEEALEHALENEMRGLDLNLQIFN